VLADAGYWHQRQMQHIVSDGMTVLVPPDAGLRKDARPGWTGGVYAFMRRVLASPEGRALYRQRQITIKPVFGQRGRGCAPCSTAAPPSHTRRPFPDSLDDRSSRRRGGERGTFARRGALCARRPSSARRTRIRHSGPPRPGLLSRMGSSTYCLTAERRWEGTWHRGA
jgi:hypothetical protein